MPPPLYQDYYPPPPMLSPSDSASTSSSSSPPSPPAFRHRLMRNRSTSPTSRHVPYLYPQRRPYSPSSREADIARLLDPAYASPAPNSPLSKPSRMFVKEVYVDHHGDLHDPDFHDFPPFGNHINPRQQRWEKPYADDGDEDEDDDDCHAEQRRSSFELQPRRPSSTITYIPSPVYCPREEPASYESRYLVEDEDEEVDEFERAPLKEKSFYSRTWSSPTRRPKAQEEKQPIEGEQVIQADSEWTPTCTQSLRRQWQAISLSFRFTLFRTKRRLRRRMTG